MVERWLQSKSNPYISTRAPRKVVMKKPFYSNQLSNPMAVQRKPLARRPMSSFSKNTAARFGVPIQLFKDSDKDGVMNVFDCKPYNKRKQDVIRPQNFGSGVGDMYARQEQARQQRDYQKMLKEMQRQEEQRIAELQRIQGETIIVDNTRTIYQDTPYVFDVTGTKLVSASSAEGKAGIAKLQSYSSGGSSGSSGTGGVYKTSSGSLVSTKSPSVGSTYMGPPGTIVKTSNALTKSPSNALTKAISNQNKTISAPAPAPKQQNAVQKAVASVKNFFSGKK